MRLVYKILQSLSEYREIRYACISITGHEHFREFIPIVNIPTNSATNGSNLVTSTCVSSTSILRFEEYRNRNNNV